MTMVIDDDGDDGSYDDDEMITKLFTKENVDSRT